VTSGGDPHLRTAGGVPRDQVAMLNYLAEQDATTVSAFLTRELVSIACAHAEELSTRSPGFAAALAWPAALETQDVC
jgi:DNA topoisomerase VI subunit B